METNNEYSCIIIANPDPTDGTHWFLAMRRDRSSVSSFNSFRIESPPLFLIKYFHLGSDERIQQDS